MREQLEPIWNSLREELRRETPDFQFHIWLEPLELAGADGRTLYVRAPDHIRTWVSERYLPLLCAAARRSYDAGATVEIVDAGWSADENEGALAMAAQEPELGLNPKYTFEQFVIGGGNRFAHAAALAVAEQPAQAYNPLFLHGAPGLGKTHLLHAVGNYVSRYGSGLRVQYATVEEFTSAFVDAVRAGRTNAFKERFRKVDVVLIDDVQFLARKERTREEFFHMFNALLDSGRQLVMTSDRCPEELPELEQRLVERFRSGLVVELEPPTLEVRRAILEMRAWLDGVSLPPEVLDEVAVRVTSSVRALEGALIRVVAYSSLKAEPVTPELVRHVLKRLGSDAAYRSCSIAQIVEASAEQFGVRAESLLARDRRGDVAAARQVAMYLARELTEHSLPEIGRGIGGRNHTTVLHAINRISAALRTDPVIRSAVDKLRASLGQPA